MNEPKQDNWIIGLLDEWIPVNPPIQQSTNPLI
jgi:hypothetical protein